jgi:predicted secreted Zn-dependent protease
VTLVEDWVWAYEKRPLTLSGKAGATTWTKVLFAAKTVDLKWTATPASPSGCTFRFRVESASLAKAVTGSQKIKGSKAASGSRGLTVKYGDGKITVTTDCATYALKIVSTSHPGMTIRQSNDPYKATGTTASELNDAMAEAWADWAIRTSTKYYSGGTIRVASFTLSLGIDYELPAWKAPEGTDQALIDAWNVALKGMRKHVEGEAAIGIQAAGRYLAASTKTSFGSMSAMNKYRDKLSDTWLDWASDKSDAYNKATDYGYTQGAFLE